MWFDLVWSEDVPNRKYKTITLPSLFDLKGSFVFQGYPLASSRLDSPLFLLIAPAATDPNAKIIIVTNMLMPIS
jgi:hypothetical protein